MDYYVYTHRKPETNEVLYVGRGSGGRAWQTGASHRCNPAHQDWLKAMMYQENITMANIVVIEASNLYFEDSVQIEKDLIEEFNPIFNRKMGVPFKLSEEDIKEARRVKDTQNITYSELAEKYNVSTMTMWRALKR